MLALAFAFFVLSYVPAGVDQLAILATASGCTRPQHVPASAGNLVAVDLRRQENGSLFTETAPETLLGQTMAELSSKTNPARDLVIFVHGFLTSFKEATCAGENLRADLASDFLAILRVRDRTCLFLAGRGNYGFGSFHRRGRMPYAPGTILAACYMG